MKQYEYEPIIDNEHAFRLVRLYPGSGWEQRLKIEIIRASLEEEKLMPYESVSYVWGSSEMCASVDVQAFKRCGAEGDIASHEEYVPDSYLKVTNSLELVLRDLRLPNKPRYLWIDGICINQNDQNDQQSREKNHQVQLMSKIYNRAKRVVIHLGRPTDLTKLLEATLHQLQEHQAVQRKPKRKRPQGLDQVRDQILQDLEELQELPNTTEEQERQKVRELEELEDKLREISERQRTFQMQKAQIPESSTDNEISESSWAQISEKLANLYTNFNERIKLSMNDALAQPWFRRVWIIQEVANSREALIYWGPTSLSVRWFVNLARKLDVQMDTHQRAILDMMPRSRRKELDMSSGQDLFDLLVRFGEAEASNSHDKLFALLGMCKHGKGLGVIAIDYTKSLACVVRDTIAYIAYCDKSDVPLSLTTIYHLTQGISSLLSDLVVDFAFDSTLENLHSLFLHRGDQITITPHLIQRLVQHGAKAEAISILLDHTPDTKDVETTILEQAYSCKSSLVAELLLTRCDEKYPATTKWTRAIRSNAQDSFPSGTQLRVVESCDAADTRQLFEEGMLKELTNINAKDYQGLTPLSRAVTAGRHDNVAILIDHGADIEVRNSAGLTALMLAVIYGKENVVKILLDRGADIETTDKNGRTPLSLAASGGHVHISSLGLSIYGAETVKRQKEERYKLNESSNKSVYIRPRTNRIDQGVYSTLFQLLLDRCPNINSTDNFNQTALWWAVNHGHGYAVEKLLVHGADPDIIFSGHMSLLSWSIWNGYEDIAAQLLSNSALSVSQLGDSLEWAIRAGNELLLRELIDRHGMINATVEFTTSPFLVAAEEGNARALQILLLHPMISLTPSLGSEALLVAVSRGWEVIVQKLLEAGCDVNTPLSLADKRGNRKMVKKLLSRQLYFDGSSLKRRSLLAGTAVGWGSDNKTHRDPKRMTSKERAQIDARNVEGKTPLMWACRNGLYYIVKLLLDANADIHVRDGRGETALDMAEQGEHSIIALMLRERTKESE